jgi:hypothetical protein
MKTPSQRRRDGAANRIKFKTQFDVDMANGVPSYEYGRDSGINYNGGTRRKSGKTNIVSKRELEKEAKKVEKARKIREAKELALKKELENRTIFDIIDIDD